jgi:hypothetical protein
MVDRGDGALPRIAEFTDFDGKSATIVGSVCVGCIEPIRNVGSECWKQLTDRPPAVKFPG